MNRNTNPPKHIPVCDLFGLQKSLAPDFFFQTLDYMWF